jgi:hypothetical protein
MLAADGGGRSTIATKHRKPAVNGAAPAALHCGIDRARRRCLTVRPRPSNKSAGCRAQTARCDAAGRTTTFTE